MLKRESQFCSSSPARFLLLSLSATLKPTCVLIYIRYDGVAAASPNEPSAFYFTVFPKTPGKYSLILTGDNGVKQEEIIYVKYIRRELDRLTVDDREMFLDAMATLWKVSTEDGVAMYGDKYKSAFYFSQVHIDAAGNTVCDQFHGGSGFISNHVFLTNYFEQSLQAVNPRTALHFMEYTRYFDSDAYWQGHLSNTADGGKWLEFMTSVWFGSNDPNTGKIVDGRWADVKVPRVSSAFYKAQGIDEAEPFWPQNKEKWMATMGKAHGYSPYGLLRSVHSLSPNEFILRFNNADRLGDVRDDAAKYGYPYTGVTCDDYATFFNMAKGLSTMEASYQMEYLTHGPIHLAFGGGGGDMCAANDDILRERFGFADWNLPYFTKWIHNFMKTEGPWLFAESPKSDAPTSLWNCSEFPAKTHGIEKIAVSMLDIEEFGSIECDAPQEFYKSEDKIDEWLNSAINSEKFGIDEFSIEDKKALMQTLANRHQFDGEMITSAAPLDPLFWVQHGSAERLWQRMEMNGIFSDAPFDVVQGCAGHSADGNLGWLKGYSVNNPTVVLSNLTVAELVGMLDPMEVAYVENFNFIYETTDYEWCPGLVDITQ